MDKFGKAIALVVAIIALAAPSTASAVDKQGNPERLNLTARVIKAERIQFAIDAARSYWGHLPECGAAGIAWGSLRSDYGIVGFTTGPCNIALATDLLKHGTPTDICVTVVHEIGHALGHDHSDHAAEGDPVNVMADGFNLSPGVPEQCKPKALNTKQPKAKQPKRKGR